MVYQEDLDIINSQMDFDNIRQTKIQDEIDDQIQESSNQPDIEDNRLNTEIEIVNGDNQSSDDSCELFKAPEDFEMPETDIVLLNPDLN